MIAHDVRSPHPGQVSNAPALVSNMAASAFSWVGGLRQQEAEPPPEENAYVYNSEIGVRPAASSLQPRLPGPKQAWTATLALSRRGSLTLTLTLTLTRALRRRGSPAT